MVMSIKTALAKIFGDNSKEDYNIEEIEEINLSDIKNKNRFTEMALPDLMTIEHKLDKAANEANRAINHQSEEIKTRKPPITRIQTTTRRKTPIIRVEDKDELDMDK